MLFDLFQLFFPKYCTHCRRRLSQKQTILCHECYNQLPVRVPSFDEKLKENLSCFFKVEKAYSLLYFKDQRLTTNLIHALKYKNQPQIGFMLGYEVTKGIKSTFDVVIPVPLHPKKLKKRGYNQSEKIAEGVAKRLQIPVKTDAIIRVKNNPSQAHLKNHTERLQNTLNVFTVTSPSFFEDKHILLVDDVITTGSTIYQCVHPLLELNNVKISVLCVGFAG